MHIQSMECVKIKVVATWNNFSSNGTAPIRYCTYLLSDPCNYYISSDYYN